MAGPEGRKLVPAHGCPAFSLGVPYYSETMLPKGYKTVLDWFQEVATEPEFRNPEYTRHDDDDESEDEVPQGGIEFYPLEGPLEEP
jgi:hypothetical protein